MKRSHSSINDTPANSNNNESSSSANSSSSHSLLNSISPAIVHSLHSSSAAAAASLDSFKPVFLTKQQRQEAALKRLEEQRIAKQSINQSIVPSILNSSKNPSSAPSLNSSVSSHSTSSSSVFRSHYLPSVSSGPRESAAKHKFSPAWNPSEDTSGASLEAEFGISNKNYQNQSQNRTDRVSSSAVESNNSKRLRHQPISVTSSHWRDKPLAEMTERDWRIFKEDFEISIRNAGTSASLMRFWAESKLPTPILEALNKAGYKEPTPIQRAAIPIGLNNLDVVGIAATGSGKTVAFVIPMLIYIMRLPRLYGSTLAENGPYAVILAPTRELAQQIETETRKLASALDIRCTSVVGGLSIEDQGFILREGVEIVIGTPGRLLDCLEKRYLVLHQCNYIVLDEADAMIDMNFEKELTAILEAMPATNTRPDNQESVNFSHHYRQTIMFSATMPMKVESLAKKFLRNPVFITIGDRKGGGRSADRIEQRIEWIPADFDRRNRLVRIIKHEEPPFIVFVNSKRNCDLITTLLESHDISCTELHGGKSQEIRSEALQKFRQGEFEVLVATDVAGRGIDVTGVQQVINYEMAPTIERYRHRIGRTGRAGKSGIATTFIGEEDSSVASELIELLKSSNQSIPRELERLESNRQKHQNDNGNGFNKSAEIRAVID